jgi:hypothetical protein
MASSECSNLKTTLPVSDMHSISTLALDCLRLVLQEKNLDAVATIALIQSTCPSQSLKCSLYAQSKVVILPLSLSLSLYARYFCGGVQHFSSDTINKSLSHTQKSRVSPWFSTQFESKHRLGRFENSIFFFCIFVLSAYTKEGKVVFSLILDLAAVSLMANLSISSIISSEQQPYLILHASSFKRFYVWLSWFWSPAGR